MRIGNVGSISTEQPSLESIKGISFCFLLKRKKSIKYLF